MLKYVLDGEEEGRDLRINESIYFTDKNSMQLFIADLDLISTTSYRGRWT